MEGIVLSTLHDLVKNPEVISEKQTNDHWSFMDYRLMR